VAIEGNPGLSTINLPLLETIGTDPPPGPTPELKLQNLPAITSMDLSALREIAGKITIYYTSLPALNLPALTTVASTLDVQNNSALSSVDFASLTTATTILFLYNHSDAFVQIAFPELTVLSGELGINYNTGLGAIYAPKLQEIGTNEFIVADLQVIGNPTLHTLDLGSLRTNNDGGSITIASSDQLDDLDLGALESVGTCLDLQGLGIDTLALPGLTQAGCIKAILNGNLTTFVFDGLTELGLLEVRYNNNLPLVRLNNLKTISGTLNMEYNQSLLDMQFDALEVVSSLFYVSHHEAMCDVIPINIRGELLQNPGETRIVDNTGSCF